MTVTKSQLGAGAIGAIGATGAAVMAAAIVLVTQWEGIKTKPYRDVVDVLTVCIGQTAGDGVDLTRSYTVPECKAMLAKSLVKYDDGMKACLKRPITDNMHVAFLSTTYNIGIDGFCGSSMARRANAGDFKGACDALLMWNKAGGRVIKGLDNRRRAEREVCLKGL
jgi:lysozyme